MSPALIIVLLSFRVLVEKSKINIGDYRSRTKKFRFLVGARMVINGAVRR